MTPAVTRLPTLAALGLDLLHTSRRRRVVVLARPGVLAGAALACALSSRPLLVVVLMVPLFLSVVVAAHDLVHGSLGLSAGLTDVLLSVVGLVVLESGHAYRCSHRRHHRQWPDGVDDPEGELARMTLLRVLLEGPVFLPRLWWWAWRRHPGQRRWLAVEAAGCLVLLAGGPLTGSGALTLYALLCVLGSWTYPLLTVHLPHRAGTRDPLLATRTLRGRVLPRLLLELTYHLEHHLYPAVPSHRYAELARRLDPHLSAAGVAPDRVW